MPSRSFPSFEEDRMITRLRGVPWILALAVAAGACAEGGGEEDAGMEGPPDRATEAAPAAATPGDPASRTDLGPDTTEAALWAYLQSESYRDGWELWPGKGELYEGQEPHGMLLTTYVNATAHDALLADGPGDLPPGSIIVKENWNPDSTFAAATVMYRVEGYNPDHDDWLFAKYDPEGGVEAFGRAAGCQACHTTAEAGYIFTPVQR
jgi:hypothetical protein